MARRKRVTPRGCPKHNRVKGIHELGGLCRAQRCGRLSFKDQRPEVPQGINDLESAPPPTWHFPKRTVWMQSFSSTNPFLQFQKNEELQRTGLVKYSVPGPGSVGVHSQFLPLCWDPSTACLHRTSLHKGRVYLARQAETKNEETTKMRRFSSSHHPFSNLNTGTSISTIEVSLKEKKCKSPFVEDHYFWGEIFLH